MSDWTKAPVAASQEWEHIATQLLATNSAVISFTGINPLYRRFVLQIYALFQSAGSGHQILMRLNSDATSPNYRGQYTSLVMLSGGGSVFSSAQRATSSGFLIAGSCLSPAGVWITLQKVAVSLQATITGRAVSRVTNAALAVTHADGHWVNTVNLISRIDLLSDFAPGTRVLLAGARDSLT